MPKSLEYLETSSVIDLAKRLIKIESLSGNEKKLATLMAIEMKKAGFNSVQYDEHNNIVGVMPGLGKGKSLVLAGYIDTVPAGDMVNPFDAQEIDGSKFGVKGKVIYGRGACDMKGGLAAMISTASALKRARARLKGDFIVVGLANTKTGKSTGVKSLLKKFELSPDFIISCVPTNLDINTAHPGQATYELLAKGKMSNIGYPDFNENAILKMNKIINCLQENVVLPEDKRLGKANMIISSITSNPIGESHSIPSFCQALLVRQYFKNEDPIKIKENFMSILKLKGFKENEVSIELSRNYNPYEVNPNSEIISILQDAKNSVMNKSTKLGQWVSGVNISEIFDINLPVVGCGPGDEKFAQSPIEHVPIDQVIAATQIYIVLAEKICIQMKEKDS